MDLSQAFQTLEVPPGATYDEAKTHYRLMVKVWHPDKHQDEKILVKATSKLQELNAAWSLVEEYYKTGGVAYAVAKDSPQDISRQQILSAFRYARMNFGIFHAGRW